MRINYRWLIGGSFALIAAIAATVVIVVISGTVFIALSDDNDKTYSLTTLKTTNDYIFDIRTESFWETAVRSILCVGMKDEETVFPLKSIGYTTEPRELEFGLIEGGENNEVIAIVEQSAPQVVVALYDLKSKKYGLYWPGWQKDREIMKELLQRLNENNPDELFVLPHDAGDDVELKLE